jgi:hypothetical protein
MDDTVNLPSVDHLYSESPLSADRLTEMIAHAVDPDTPDPDIDLPGDDAGAVDLAEFDESDGSGDSADSAEDTGEILDVEEDELLADGVADAAHEPLYDSGTDDGAGADTDYGDATEPSHDEPDPDDPLAGF